MAPARPLRDVFGDLVGGAAGPARSDPAQSGDVLRASGHADLPESLVAEAIVNFADTAPAEVAEHLAPYVMAHSPVPAEAADSDPAQWLDLLATAPTGLPEEELGDAFGVAPESGPVGGGHQVAFDLDFGHGDAGALVPTGADHATGHGADDWTGHWTDDPAAGVDSGLFGAGGDIAIDIAIDDSASDDSGAGDGADDGIDD